MEPSFARGYGRAQQNQYWMVMTAQKDSKEPGVKSKSDTAGHTFRLRIAPNNPARLSACPHRQRSAGYAFVAIRIIRIIRILVCLSNQRRAFAAACPRGRQRRQCLCLHDAGRRYRRHHQKNREGGRNSRSFEVRFSRHGVAGILQRYGGKYLRDSSAG